MQYTELTNEQRRQIVDLQQIFTTLSEAKKKHNHSFSGSMRWLMRKKVEYLHIKKGNSEKSLGPRSKKTEEIYDTFMEGRQEIKKQISNLEARLKKMAPVNRALNLGRVPKHPAKDCANFPSLIS